MTLACAKSKGVAFDDVVLRLDRAARWFEVTNETPPRIATNYELVVNAVGEFGRAATRKEIEFALNGKVTKSSVGRSLDEAVLRGDVIKPKHGVYALAANTQILMPIRREYLSISQNELGSDEFVKEH